MKPPTVGDLLDDPVFGPALQERVDRDSYECDLRILEIEQRMALRDGVPVSKALWQRIIRYRRDHPGS